MQIVYEPEYKHPISLVFSDFSLSLTIEQAREFHERLGKVLQQANPVDDEKDLQQANPVDDEKDFQQANPVDDEKDPAFGHRGKS